jgi:hypothetical protein
LSDPSNGHQEIETGQSDRVIEIAQEELKAGHYDAEYQSDETVFLNKTLPVPHQYDAIKVRQGRFGKVFAQTRQQPCFGRYDKTRITVRTADTLACVFFRYCTKQIALWAMESQQLNPSYVLEVSNSD